MSIKGYDQWKTASPDDDAYNHDLKDFADKVFERVVGSYGRRQHGLNGKDADLDAGGQIVVKEIHIIDEVKHKNLTVRAIVHQYANICTPTDDDDAREAALQRYAEDLILDATEYDGEWTGSDYWCFHRDGLARCECTVDELEGCDVNKVAERVYNTIRADANMKAFEAWAADLFRSVNDLHKLSNADLGI